MIVPYNEAHSIDGCEDCARPWNPLPRCSTQGRLPPGMAWITQIFAGPPLGQRDACPWPFVAAPAPSLQFLDRNCRTVRQRPTHHPRPLLYIPVKSQGNTSEKRGTTHMRISSLNRVVRARLLTFCSFGRMSTLPFAGEPGWSVAITLVSIFRSASKSNTSSFNSCNSFTPFSDTSLGGSFPSRGVGIGARAAQSMISCRARSGSGSSESMCL